MTISNNEDQKQYVDAAQVAYKLARECLPRYAHAKSPHHFTFQQLGGIVLLRTVMRLSYREMQQYLLESDEVDGTRCNASGKCGRSGSCT